MEKKEKKIPAWVPHVLRIIGLMIGAGILFYPTISSQWNRYRDADNKKDKLLCLDKINTIDDFLFVNDNVYDKYGTLIQAKVIDYGYAHTIHKSQGSTFKHVLINDDDISRCLDKKVRKQLRYVALTRAQKSANIITSHTVN